MQTHRLAGRLISAGKGTLQHGPRTGAALAAVAAALLWIPVEAQAACAPAAASNVNATCTATTTDQGGGAPGTSAGINGYGTSAETNLTTTVIPGATVTGSISSGIAFSSGTVNNSGAVSGNTQGIAFGGGTVSNSGNISAPTSVGAGIFASGTATITNSGTVSGGDAGINAGIAIITNSGTISGGNYGFFGSNVTVTNSGTISGGTDGIYAGTTANVSNSGTISGGLAALQFFSNPDTLTLLPGSILVGAINLGGGGDTVNFMTGGQNLTFSGVVPTTVTSTVPYVVAGSQVATVDPTPFAMADRNLIDFTSGVSAAVSDRFADDFSSGDSSTPTALGYAEESPAKKRFAEAFGDIDHATVRYADGTTVWGRGFGGQRVQAAHGPLIEATDRFYGGLIGFDWQAQAYMRFGAFIGGGQTHSSEDPYLGHEDSDLFFGGLYGRYDRGAAYLGLALQGGHSSIDSTRTINNNLVPGGIETATAGYDGWYVSPEATFGRHYGLGSRSGASWMLTPSVNLRYLYASLGGYTEGGTTTAPLTVGTRMVNNFEERGQLTLTRSQPLGSKALTTSLYGGVLGVQRAGSTVDATLLGQAIPFATPGQGDVWGGFGGACLELHTGRVVVFASGEYLALSDNGSVVNGQGGLRVAF